MGRQDFHSPDRLCKTAVPDKEPKKQGVSSEKPLKLDREEVKILQDFERGELNSINISKKRSAN